jgi:fucose 4-O-acetylase-like acetyltransferase
MNNGYGPPQTSCMDAITPGNRSGLTPNSLNLKRDRPQRLVGFDLFRGIAAFGVIFNHIGIIAPNPAPDASRPEIFVGFAVPFFLLTSFFFATKRPIQRGEVKDTVARRAKRLLVPFAIWSLAYFALRDIKVIIQHVHTTLGVPLNIFILGGSGVQMYFLPLLFVGLSVLFATSDWLSRWNVTALGAGFTVAFAIQTAITATGNGFSLDGMTAFKNIIPITSHSVIADLEHSVFGLAAYGLKCIPLIFIAFLLRKLLPGSPTPTVRAIILIIGLLLLLLKPLLPVLDNESYFDDEIYSLGGFLTAWSLSFFLPSNSTIKRIGVYTFGIYLCHQVYLECFQIMLKKHNIVPQPTDVSVLLLIVLLVFVLSYSTVALADKLGPFMRTVFAIEG